MTGKTDKQLGWLFCIGRPLSPLYSYLMAWRSHLYRNGFLKQHRLEVPVISVGNLILGGTGKTPLVQYIARMLQKHDHKPAILSRGYKGTAAAAVNVVSDTRKIFLKASEAGDEPRLLAEKLPGIPVITGKKRYVTGRFAIDSFDADTLILDDGFQHLALKRDLDLVLFSAGKRLGNGRVLPGGDLREPLSALQRADAFIITDAESSLDSSTKEFIAFLERLHPDTPLFKGMYVPGEELTRLHQGKIDIISQTEAGSIPLYAFCGIARPESFKNTLNAGKMNITGFQGFTDHHSYTAEDIRSLLDNAEKSGAKGLVTTEKDLVKLHEIFPRELPLIVQPVQMLFDKEFDRFLLNHFPAGQGGAIQK